MTLRLGLRENRTAFKPGDEIAGAAIWECDTAPKLAEVRLCWYTRGKGSEDTETVEKTTFDAPAAGDTRTFSFRAPSAPYSFSGKLISLIWAVELVIEPGNESERVDIVIAPEAREIELPDDVPQPSPSGRIEFNRR